MKSLFETLTPEVRRDLQAVQRELAPRRSGSMLNTTFSKGSATSPEATSNGAVNRESADEQKSGS